MKFLLYILLWLPSKLFQFGVSVRNWLYDSNLLHAESVPIPTIVVGNLSVGGSGKSPHVEYLVRLLMSKHKVGTLSRGYGRKTSGFRKVERTDSAEEVGDEPLQFKRKFPTLTVAVCENRVAGVKAMIQADPELEVILLDDAFQHRRLKPGFSVLLTTYDLPYYKDELLPAGRLRESVAGATRANCIVVTKCPHMLTDANRTLYTQKLQPRSNCPVLFTRITYGEPISLTQNEKTLTTASLLSDGWEFVVATGIANPAPLIDFLSSGNGRTHHISFADHHAFSPADIGRIRKIFDNIAHSKKLILTTEKDAVRLSSASLADAIGNLPVYYLPIRIVFDAQDQVVFDQQISRYVAGANAGNG